MPRLVFTYHPHPHHFILVVLIFIILILVLIFIVLIIIIIIIIINIIISSSSSSTSSSSSSSSSPSIFIICILILTLSSSSSLPSSPPSWFIISCHQQFLFFPGRSTQAWPAVAGTLDLHCATIQGLFLRWSLVDMSHSVKWAHQKNTVPSSRMIGYCFSLWNSDFSNLIVFNLKRFESLFVAPLLLQNNVFEPCVRKHHDTASQSDTDFVCIFHNDWDYFLDKHMIFSLYT